MLEATTLPTEPQRLKFVYDISSRIPFLVCLFLLIFFHGMLLLMFSFPNVFLFTDTNESRYNNNNKNTLFQLLQIHPKLCQVSMACRRRILVLFLVNGWTQCDQKKNREMSIKVAQK